MSKQFQLSLSESFKTSLIHLEMNLCIVGKLTSSLGEKFMPFGEIVLEFPETLRLRQLGITSFKMGYKTLQRKFPKCHPTPA